jgi:membrane protein implicated in regulation of membrane protease activity
MLFFLEMAVPGFILFFFGLGAFVTALVAWLTPISIAWQLALFIVTSLSALWSLRDIIQKKFLAPKGEDEEGEGGDEDEDVTVPIAGEKGVVSMTIAPPAEGQVKYSGTFWRATADEEIEEGEIIAVVRRKGIVIHVEKV